MYGEVAILGAGIYLKKFAIQLNVETQSPGRDSNTM